MNIKEFKKLKKEEWYNPTIIFSLRSNEMVKEEKRYKFHIFNHVQLHFPYNAEIVEAPQNLSSIKQSSSDKYMDFGGVKIILPLFIRTYAGGEDGVDFRFDKEMPDEYYNCADFVRKYLVKAGILKEEKSRPSVDELYFELYQKGFVPSAEVLNKWHFEKKDISRKESEKEGEK